MSNYTNVPDLLADREVAPLLRALNVGQRPPAAPLYIYQGVFDEVMPLADVDALVRRYCRWGGRVRYERFASDHLVLAATAWPRALDYLADRFAGKPPADDCR